MRELAPCGNPKCYGGEIGPHIACPVCNQPEISISKLTPLPELVEAALDEIPDEVDFFFKGGHYYSGEVLRAHIEAQGLEIGEKQREVNKWQAKYWAHDAEIERLRGALQSIADNKCCGSCQEAALVAKVALAPSPAEVKS